MIRTRLGRRILFKAEICERGGIGQLTVFALALLDLRLVLDALVARLAVEPRPDGNANIIHFNINFLRCIHCPRVEHLYAPFDFLRRLRDEEADGAGGELGAPRVDGDLAVVVAVGLDLDGEEEQLQLDEAELRGLRERHPREGGRQRLRVHLAARALQVVVLPLQRVRTLRKGEGNFRQVEVHESIRYKIFDNLD